MYYLQSSALDHLEWYPVLQHLHEAGVAVPPDHLGLPLGLLGGVRMEVDLDIGIGLLLGWISEAEVLNVVHHHVQGVFLVIN